MSGATPHSNYTHVGPDGKVVQNAIYDANGNVIGHVDFYIGRHQARRALSNCISRSIQMSYRFAQVAFAVRFEADSFSCIGLVSA